VLKDTVQVLAVGSVTNSFDVVLCQGDSVQIGPTYYLLPGTYIDTLESTTGCDSIVNVSLTVETPPLLNTVSPDTVCAGTTVVLSATGAANYQWSSSGTIACSTCANASMTALGNSMAVVTGFNMDGCESYDTVYVTVIPTPEFEIEDPVFTPCRPDVTLTVNGEPHYVYAWSPTELFADPASATAVVYPTNPTTYTVTVFDTTGCSTSAAVAVDYYEGGFVTVPNAFSPNLDGLNDVYRLIFLCPIELDYYRIYNRWGQMLFETAKSETGWNGTYKLQDCEIGVYVYVVSGTLPGGEPFFLKGNVTLLR
ncbi:MAG TPA: gliding motility-associated C-terminal domain-containing protein, partial [Chitinophagales bacterium]|nr:gliding motility-associated C-terminal domain-containing protein [Chitinophagales bacterium]